MKDTKKIGTFIVAGIILVGVIIVGFMITNKNSSKSTAKNKTNSKTANTSIKINSKKDYVYDADYKSETKHSKYAYDKKQDKILTDDKVNIEDKITTVNDGIVNYKYNENVSYVKDLKVPYININSDAALSVNTTLEKMYTHAYKKFDNFAETKEPFCSQVLDYKAITNKDILSVIVVEIVNCSSQPITNYHTYNFDLKTGNLLTYQDIYSGLNISESDLKTKVEEAITKKQKEKMANDEEYESDFDTFKEESIKNYEEAVSNGEVKYYLSEQGKLNIITTFSLPQGSGEFEYNIEID